MKRPTGKVVAGQPMLRFEVFGEIRWYGLVEMARIQKRLAK